MSVAARPRAVAFDVVETLFSLEPLRQKLVARGASANVLELWFTRMLRDAFAVTLAGGYLSFQEASKAALAAVIDGAAEADIESVLGVLAELDPHADVVPALARLREAAVPLFALTNGGAANTENLLAKAGLDRYIQRVISVDEVQVWKPAPLPYRHAADVAGVAPGDLALVAVHAWDVHGAKRAGLIAGWAARLEGRFSPVFEKPDVRGDTLEDVAAGLLALPDSPP